MIVLDENIRDSERSQLRRWRIPVCKIGRDVSRRGLQDLEILPLLRTLRRPTFVSRDRDAGSDTGAEPDHSQRCPVRMKPGEPVPQTHIPSFTGNHKAVKS